MKRVNITQDIRVNFDDNCSYRQFLQTEESFVRHYGAYCGKVVKKERIIITLLAMKWTYRKIRERSGISERQIKKTVKKFELKPLNRRKP